jgi:hypothetical protein
LAVSPSEKSKVIFSRLVRTSWILKKLKVFICAGVYLFGSETVQIGDFVRVRHLAIGLPIKIA